jgi:hypothetical protein
LHFFFALEHSVDPAARERERGGRGSEGGWRECAFERRAGARGGREREKEGGRAGELVSMEDGGYKGAHIHTHLYTHTL